MSTEVVVSKLPKCDFCDKTAEYDFATSMGPWAYGCKVHWHMYRASDKLGTGIGQKLISK
jgi:hypothetical protein